MSRGELMGVNYIADGRPEVLAATRENLRAGATQIKIMAGGGAATLYDPLDVTHNTLDEMKAAVDAAEDWGTYVTVHAYTTERCGGPSTPASSASNMGNCSTSDTIKLMAQKGIWLSLQALDEAPPSSPRTSGRRNTRWWPARMPPSRRPGSTA